MLGRFAKIQRDFGTGTLLRTLLLVAGFVGMSAAGIVFFSSYVPLWISLVGLVAGCLLRATIAEKAEYAQKISRASLILYGIVLVVGDRLGVDHITKLSIITAMTVLVFDLQFWTLSDPEVIHIPSELEAEIDSLGK